MGDLLCSCGSPAAHRSLLCLLHLCINDWSFFVFVVKPFWSFVLSFFCSLRWTRGTSVVIRAGVSDCGRTVCGEPHVERARDSRLQLSLNVPAPSEFETYAW